MSESDEVSIDCWAREREKNLALSEAASVSRADVRALASYSVVLAAAAAAVEEVLEDSSEEAIFCIDINALEATAAALVAATATFVNSASAAAESVADFLESAAS